MSFFRPEIVLLQCRNNRLSQWNFFLKSPWWRIYHNDDWGGALRSGDRRIDMSPDQVYLLAPDTDAISSLEQPFNHLYIHFTAGLHYDCPSPGIYAVPYVSPARELVDAVKAELTRSDRSAVRLALLSLALSHFMLAAVPDENLDIPIEDRRVRKVMRYIKTRYREKISNSELAAMSSMNINAFIRLFSRSAGRSPQQYLLECRMRQACLLLHYSGRSIEEIAEETGFCNRHYFTRQFTRCRGISPARFRNLNIR